MADPVRMPAPSAGTLSEDQLQVLGGLPLDPSRANPKAVAMLADLQARALIAVDRDSHALLLSASGRHALEMALRLAGAR